LLDPFKHCKCCSFKHPRLSTDTVQISVALFVRIFFIIFFTGLLVMLKMCRTLIFFGCSLDVQNHANKAFGVGVYLAKHAIYSDTIRPHVRPDGTKQLIFAKVVLGKCYDYGATTPNCIEAMEPVGHHSVSGTEGDMAFVKGWDWTSTHQELIDNGAEYGRQYVVRRSERVYPAYLVTYTNNPS
jgi:hypothetical protein